MDFPYLKWQQSQSALTLQFASHRQETMAGQMDGQKLQSGA